MNAFSCSRVPFTTINSSKFRKSVAYICTKMQKLMKYVFIFYPKRAIMCLIGAVDHFYNNSVSTGTGEKRTRQAHDATDKKRGHSEGTPSASKKKKVKTVDVDLPDAPPDGWSRCLVAKSSLRFFFFFFF